MIRQSNQTKRVVLLAAISLPAAGAGAAEATLERDFKNPPLSLKSWPLSHLNGKLTTEEIAAQLRDSRDKSGLAGVAVLPVTATEREYLSEEYLTFPPMKSFLSMFLFLALATAAALGADAGAAKKKGVPRATLTEEERRAHLAPLPPADKSLVTPDTTFEEKDGVVVIEAEHFTRQTRDQIRRWYFNSVKHTPTAKPDPDPVMVTDASNGIYIEALPDTFVHDGERAIDGINIGLAPGSIAVVHYPVHFTKPGRYYIWTRMRSNDDEDNTLNFGLNDDWPASARCLQFPKLKKTWWWGGVIRDARGPSFPHHRAFIDVPTAGVHTVMYSMREDGMEFDKFMLTMDGNMKSPEGPGPAASLFKTGKLVD